MAKAYKSCVVYTFSKALKIKNKHKRTEVGTNPYKTPEEALQEANSVAEDMSKHNRNFKLIETKIEEFEIPDKVEYEGQVTEEGRWEDYIVLVGDADIQSAVSQFSTRKVKVTIELID